MYYVTIVMDRMDLTQIISANEVHIPNICLLCLETTNNLLEVFGTFGIDLNVAAILGQHFWFDVKYPKKFYRESHCLVTVEMREHSVVDL